MNMQDESCSNPFIFVQYTCSVTVLWKKDEHAGEEHDCRVAGGLSGS